MKYFRKNVLWFSILIGTAGFFVLPVLPAPSVPPAPLSGPRVLSDIEAHPYYEVFNKFPEKIRKAFGWTSLSDDDLSYHRCRVMNDHPYPQTILMPNGETLMIISGLGEVGLVIFNTTNKQIKEAFSWSEYLKTAIKEPIYCFEKVHYRFIQYEDRWELVVEVHAIIGVGRFEPMRHYLWEFTYARYLDGAGYGSEFRYCTKDTRDRIERSDP